jgi:hypothetical protein
MFFSKSDDAQKLITSHHKNITKRRLPPLGSHVVRDIVWTGVVVGDFDVVWTEVLLS